MKLQVILLERAGDMHNGSINYLIRGNNSRSLHPHRWERLQLPYSVDLSSQLFQQGGPASITATLIINIHCFSNPAGEQEVELQRADQRVRVEDGLN